MRTNPGLTPSQGQLYAPYADTHPTHLKSWDTRHPDKRLHVSVNHGTSTNSRMMTDARTASDSAVGTERCTTPLPECRGIHLFKQESSVGYADW